MTAKIANKTNANISCPHLIAFPLLYVFLKNDSKVISPKIPRTQTTIINVVWLQPSVTHALKSSQIPQSIEIINNSFLDNFSTFKQRKQLFFVYCRIFFTTILIFYRKSHSNSFIKAFCLPFFKIIVNIT